MELQKFAIKLFLNMNESYSSKDFVPVFHNWIQDKVISDHLLIDVADYSHVPDGPGVMLIAHEGHFSLDQENHQPGIMYMRKTDLDGTFNDRFNKILSTVIEVADRLRNSKVNMDINFISNSFRFITNDRLYAENTIENQNLYKERIQNALNDKYPDNEVDYEEISGEKERLAFTIRFSDAINILE